MILDHEWMAAAADLVEHGPGIVSGVIGVVLYALIRDGLPRYKRWRENSANPGNPGNPGNHSIAKRVLACEAGIGEVREACARADERWKAQADHNKRMEKHIEKIYERIDKVAGG